MVKMKIYRYVTGVLLLVVMALLFQNMQMHKVLKISGEIADGNAKQNYDRLEYILEHFDNNVVDSTKTFIRCAESIEGAVPFPKNKGIRCWVMHQPLS